jgi:hypothetical protein
VRPHDLASTGDQALCSADVLAPKYTSQLRHPGDVLQSSQISLAFAFYIWYHIADLSSHMAGIYHHHSSFCSHCTHHRADSDIVDLVANIHAAFDSHQIFDYGLFSIPIRFSTIPQHYLD